MALEEGFVALAFRTWQRLPVRITATIALLVAVSSLALAFGYVPGFDGFVRHSELAQRMTEGAALRQVITTRLDSQEGAINLITKNSIEASIRAKLVTRCMTKDAAFRSELSEEIAKLEDEYYALTTKMGMPSGYRQPACDEL